MAQLWAYLNGQFVPREQAKLDVEDRAALFGDGVYEVTHFYHGRPLAMDRHLARLRDSLAGIALPAPADVAQLPAISAELARRQAMPDCAVYWQISRGAAPRKHLFPPASTPATVLVLAYPSAKLDPAAPAPCVKAILVPDERWHHCCYKTLMLLPNVLAKNRAAAAGADEAIQHRGPRVTEGSSTNAFAVRSGTLFTHPTNQWILPGVTRALVLEAAQEEGLPVREEPVTVDELRASDEVFITGSTTGVAAVTTLDGAPIAQGRCGPLTQRLHGAFVRRILRDCPPE